MDVDEDRGRADQHRDFRGGAEGEGRADHRVARADAERAQAEHQRIGAAGAGDRMTRSAEGGKLGLEGADFRADDELAVGEHPRDRIVDRGAETLALGGEVDEGNHRGLRSHVHGSIRR